jgi:hypothetical protein
MEPSRVKMTLLMRPHLSFIYRGRKMKVELTQEEREGLRDIIDGTIKDCDSSEEEFWFTILSKLGYDDVVEEWRKANP